MIKMNSQDLTLLSEGQIWGNDSESQLEVIRKYGTKAAITDLCVLTGYVCSTSSYMSIIFALHLTNKFTTLTNFDCFFYFF